MAILSKEDYMARVKSRIGEDNSDEAISFMEDMTDTYADLETKISGEGADEWKKKYEELDKAWREKYKARFFENSDGEEAKEKQKKDVIDDGEKKTYSELFEEKEG